MYTLGDFYAGTGGVSLGFDRTERVETIYAVDFNEKCKQTFDMNHDIELEIADIGGLKTGDLPDMDIITAGFNCQPFSVAGKKKGFEDSRTNSLKKLFKIIKRRKPKCVFIENVKGLLTHNKGKSMAFIVEQLHKAGMQTVKSLLLNTSEHTRIPQNRERVFIICFRHAVPDELLNEILTVKPIRDIRDWHFYLEDSPPAKYFYTQDSAIFDSLAPEVVDKDAIYQYRRGVVRKNKSGVCPCLTATMGTGGHNVPIILTEDGIRKLTPRECFNLQGMKPEFRLPDLADGHLYKQAGNAVTASLIHRLAKRVIKLLDLEYHS